MKRILFLLVFLFSFLLLGENVKIPKEKKEIELSQRVTSDIKFLITRKELESILKKEAVESSKTGGGIAYEYLDVKDSFNNNFEHGSFLFLSNSLMSTVLVKKSSVQEHKKILASYKDSYNSRKDLTKVENKKANAILYYNVVSLVYVKYVQGHTIVVIQMTNPENLANNIREINSLK